MATQSKDLKLNEIIDVNDTFALSDGQSYLISCNDSELTISDQDDGDDVPAKGLTVRAKFPLIIKPEAGKTIFAWATSGGTVVVTETT